MGCLLMRERSPTTQLKGVVDDVAYSIQIPQAAVNKLLLGQNWAGEVSIGPQRKQPSRTGSGRAGAIHQQVAQKGKFKDTVRATVDERLVLRAWNRSRYIQAQERSGDRESRNFPLPFNKIKESLPVVRKALSTVGLHEVIRTTEAYFDFCSAGGHVWDNSNHGYKTITGFLQKLVAVKKAKEKPWWDTKDSPKKQAEDNHPKLTKRVADSFAQTFMDEEKFPLEEGSKEHRFFIKTAAQIVNYISRKKRQGLELTQKEMITNLFEFVMELFDDKSGTAVYPSHLASSAIWSAFPQYLQEKGVI